MTVVLEIACRGTLAEAEAVRAWCNAGPARNWPSIPDLRRLDAYLPAAGRAEDPFCDDGLGPLALLMLRFDDVAALERAAASGRLMQDLAELPAGVSASAIAMRETRHPVAGETEPSPVRAPFSYVVRYYRPVEDEAKFVAYYVERHPALLARLPRIQNIMCFVPVPWSNPLPLPTPDYMLGNEVTFASMDDFNKAMNSEERREARKDFHEFPPFTGRNTHYPMDRVRLHG